MQYAETLMNKKTTTLLAAVVLFTSVVSLRSAPTPAYGPEYTNHAQLKLPENYRERVYLTTGFDMSYSFPGAHFFDGWGANRTEREASQGRGLCAFIEA